MRTAVPPSVTQSDPYSGRVTHRSRSRTRRVELHRLAEDKDRLLRLATGGPELQTRPDGTTQPTRWPPSAKPGRPRPAGGVPPLNPGRPRGSCHLAFLPAAVWPVGHPATADLWHLHREPRRDRPTAGPAPDQHVRACRDRAVTPRVGSHERRVSQPAGRCVQVPGTPPQALGP